MQRAFTLVELLVVIIILSVLATLGFQQYIRVVEKTRVSEAKMVLGHMRDVAVAYYAENRDTAGFDNSMAGVGPGDDQIPDACKSSHYFFYSVVVVGGDSISFIANRCTAGGKEPQGPAGQGLFVNSILSGGPGSGDTWTYTPAYQ